MIGVDTSFLVGLTVEEHTSHHACWELFDREIVGKPASMAITAQVLTEFYHVITDGRRFERPLVMTAALDLCEQWWHAEESRVVVADAEVGAVWLVWIRERRLGRKRLLDTMLAATYYRAGVRRLASTNWRDFASYGVFELERL
ncbi:MAG: PIN domain-containing protein [Gemmataceae bacterium]